MPSRPSLRRGWRARRGLSDFVKLEVIGDQKTLFPDVVDLLEATRVLAKEGFIVMPYTNDDPVMAKKLEDAGAAVVMPLGAPIGFRAGHLQPPTPIRLIMEAVQVPVIVDAGVGHGVRRHGGPWSSGVDGRADEHPASPAPGIPWPWPTPCACPWKRAALAYKAGRIERKLYATASSPLEGVIGT